MRSPAHVDTQTLVALFLFQRRAHRHGARRIDGALAFLNVLDNALLVDHKGGAARKLLLIIQDAIFFGDFARHVAQQGELHAQLLGEFSISEGTVNADAQNRSVIQIDFAIGDISLIRLQLVCSIRTEGHYVEREDDALLSAEVAKFNGVPVLVRQGEVRCQIAHLQVRLCDYWLLGAPRHLHGHRQQEQTTEQQGKEFHLLPPDP
jgi:hypothetical protein